MQANLEKKNGHKVVQTQERVSKWPTNMKKIILGNAMYTMTYYYYTKKVLKIASVSRIWHSQNSNTTDGNANLCNLFGSAIDKFTVAEYKLTQ